MKKVYVEITNACNLNCNFCIHNSRKQEFMTLDNFKIILKKLDGYTVEDLENALADINYEYIYIDANGREDKNATRGTRADIKIISQVNW